MAPTMANLGDTVFFVEGENGGVFDYRVAIIAAFVGPIAEGNAKLTLLGWDGTPATLDASWSDTPVVGSWIYREDATF